METESGDGSNGLPRIRDKRMIGAYVRGLAVGT
jgi:hypothetical protein